MEKNSGFENVFGSSSSRGSINNRHDPGNLKEKYFLFKRTRISILVYIIYTLLYRDLNCHLLQIFIICFIQTHSPMESSSVFNLLGMHLSSYLQSGFCRWFLIKTWTQVFVEMKGRIVRLQFLLFYQDFLKRKTTGHCIDVNKYK